MTAETHDNPQLERFPKPVLIGAGAVVGLALLFTTLVRLEVIDAGKRPENRVEVMSRSIQFEDGKSGEVIVRDAKSGEAIEILEPTSNGFLRATMRGLAGERKKAGAGPEAAFDLKLWENGGLSLIDPVTGQEVALGAFGVTNARVFARFLGTPQVKP
ncbi:MAG: photosynthetic complex assembly protein PuhC [Chromatiaceae bacterium]